MSPEKLAAAETDSTTTGPDGAAESVPSPATASERRSPGSLVRRAARSASIIAFLTWIVALPLAFWLPDRLQLDPFVQRSANLPLAVLLATTVVLGAISLRWRGPWLIGVSAGAFAAYAALVMRSALSGTPFGYSDFAGAGERISAMGDSGRMAAMAVRYTVSWGTADGIVGTVASEYPPLYPYLIGKSALLLDEPAWMLIKPAQTVTMSLALLAGFVLWARVVPPAAALVITPLNLLLFLEPSKAYEMLALAVTVPLVLQTVARPGRGRLHWLPAGLLYSTLLLTYYAYLLFGAIGVLAFAWWTWRHEDDRRAYLRYLGRILALVAVLTAWYTIPYLWSMLGGGQQIGDQYSDGRLSINPFPFLSMSLFGLLQLIGLLGLLWYSRSRWWAPPLLSMVGGVYAYQAISYLRWVLTAHNGLLYYSRYLVGACLVAGAVLSAREAVPALAQRARHLVATGSVTVVVAVTMAFTGYGFWYGWMPVNHWKPRLSHGAAVSWKSTEHSNHMASRAHYMYFPDGSQPRHAAQVSSLLPRLKGDGQWRYLPIDAIQRTVHEVRPHDVRPHVLSYDEQLFAFLPWNGHLGVDRVASYAAVRWPDRFQRLVELSRITDPAAFAQATARTGFGPIDVFVLQARGDDLVWRGIQVPPPQRDLHFTRAQFSDPQFVVKDLGYGTVIAVRRPS
ncbi:arabinofuranosyltransferase [Actinomadura hibisca]|uniref:arabinofuranosyltransferase n=1 Tax=Actinomadura hibisca TaxID=68565 RepID=UPI00083624BA|nr:arabinofuranosyltransferase [Actinomadura hibisca]